MGTIRIDGGYQSQAERVLMAVEARRDELKGNLVAETFDNGREQGYTLRHDARRRSEWDGVDITPKALKGKREVSFSEARSSDSIVAYPFKWDDDDEARKEANWKALSRYFPYGDFDAAATLIIRYLNSGKIAPQGVTR